MVILSLKQIARIMGYTHKSAASRTKRRALRELGKGDAKYITEEEFMKWLGKDFLKEVDKT